MLYQTAFRNAGPSLNDAAVAARFRENYQASRYVPLNAVYAREAIETWKTIAAEFRSRFQNVLVFGTGGSSLGGKTLCALSRETSPTLHFMDNIDPETFERLFARLDPKTTGALIISKSGSTAETLMQAATLRKVWGENFSEQCLIITEPASNTLRTWGEAWGVKTLDHPKDIGGRFSCFSVVGLLPALIAGLDALEILEGAQETLEHHLGEMGPAFEAASLLLKTATPTHIMMPYCDHLLPFAFWWKQLWAESLGKDGKGYTPSEALGTVDQHSQLQLYLDGPQDKFFTFITASQKGRGWKVEGLPLFAGKTMGDLLAAEQEATIETVATRGRPLREIHLEEVTPRALGALMMHFMIETIVMADLLGVNAFDQPAVEHGKELTRKILVA